jgi:hypothetical protein
MIFDKNNERIRNCLIVCPLITLFGILQEMSNFFRSLQKLRIGLMVDFILTLSNIWPVVWQYDDD